MELNGFTKNEYKALQSRKVWATGIIAAIYIALPFFMNNIEEMKLVYTYCLYVYMMFIGATSINNVLGDIKTIKTNAMSGNIDLQSILKPEIKEIKPQEPTPLEVKPVDANIPSIPSVFLPSDLKAEKQSKSTISTATYCPAKKKDTRFKNKK